MRRISFFSLILVVLVFGTVACGEAPTPRSVQVDATPVSEVLAVSDWPEQAEPLVQKAIDDVVQRAQVDAAVVQVLLVEPVDWPNSCLGYVKEGEMCLDVITPGYRLVLQAEDHRYEYHSDYERVVYYLTEEKRDMSIGDDSTDAAGLAVTDLAVADLAGRLGLASEEIVIVQVEEMMWRDSSLGCPQPGQMYLQVITPGYRITLEAQGQQYDYHTASSGNVILCEQ